MKAFRKITIILAIVGLLTSVSLADTNDATGKELITAAIMGLVSGMSILALTIKDEKDYGKCKKCN
ncbi:hypothetical protein DWW69_16090 [Bacteroides sp. AF16-49]|uniref:hypothetical protein n=1 Tax=Bacteroides sp. AF16-49 TaxID=2292192 RepID=UPI000EFF4C7E|nr:hypothetical protein [Bacteroides sp. AF16-49]RHR72415.1 hypothetical protein DWW69_16090 [Bacteroides sp. AF16-49]